MTRSAMDRGIWITTHQPQRVRAITIARSYIVFLRVYVARSKRNRCTAMNKCVHFSDTIFSNDTSVDEVHAILE
jgi:hypothetical protein